MRVPTSLAVLLAAAAGSLAGDVRKVDPPAKAEWVTIPCDPVLTVFAAEKPGTWEVVDAHPAVCLRPHADGKGASFAAPAGSSTRVIVTTAGGVQRLRLVVPGPPDPMPPGPGPGPTPPPAPVDPLVVKLQSAYAAETDAGKATAVKDKIELYRQAAKLAADPAVPTVGELVRRVRQAADALDTDRLPAVRRVVRAEIQSVLPEDVPLDAGTRAKAVAVFERISKALEAVK